MGLVLLGAPELTVDGEAVHLKRRKSVALISYLSLADRPQTREHLATMLWPESDAAHALASLRLALHDITSATDWIDTEGDLIRFRHDKCPVDVIDFESLLDSAVTEE